MAVTPSASGGQEIQNELQPLNLMSQREIRARSRADMVSEYPIEGELTDWYFRIAETSNNAWLVEGCDIWGRKVSRTGADPDELLVACVRDAKQILHGPSA